VNVIAMSQVQRPFFSAYLRSSLLLVRHDSLGQARDTGRSGNYHRFHGPLVSPITRCMIDGLIVCPRLTKFNKQLVEMYLDIPATETRCGYACSDQCVKVLFTLPHSDRSRSASWMKANYPSVFTIGLSTCLLYVCI
jgi:hypothetical protein